MTGAMEELLLRERALIDRALFPLLEDAPVSVVPAPYLCHELMPLWPICGSSETCCATSSRR
jgi:hypothetical protein